MKAKDLYKWWSGLSYEERNALHKKHKPEWSLTKLSVSAIALSVIYKKEHD